MQAENQQQYLFTHKAADFVAVSYIVIKWESKAWALATDQKFSDRRQAEAVAEKYQRKTGYKHIPCKAELINKLGELSPLKMES